MSGSPAGTTKGTKAASWPRAAAALLLAFAAIAIWWPVLGAGVLWAAPMAVLAGAVVAGLVPAGGRRLVSPVGWIRIAWFPVAPLLAGLPISVLAPSQLLDTFGTLLDALALGIRDPSSVPGDPWMLGAWLLSSGSLWLLGAVHAANTNRAVATYGFFMLAAPFAIELAMQRGDDAAWHGAVVLVAALLWATRGSLRAAMPAAAAIAVVATVVSAAIGPEERWTALGGAPPPPQFTSLDTAQTYGPMQSEQSGATMLEIDADGPALWRMQVLDWFDGRGWSLDGTRGDVELAQPAAVNTGTRVTVRGLRDQRVVSPGRVVSVSGVGVTRPALGESTDLGAPPAEGTSYVVRSSVVAPSADDLANVPVPTGREYERFTQVFPGRADLPSPAAALADNLPPEWNYNRWGEVLVLARRLSAGTTSQLEVVRRVQSFLTESGQYRYTLDVADAGSAPLVDFLLDTRKGYCQHFAGAAALLLRFAGVPTRVAVGFATGTQIGAGRFKVADKDAHAWIEVYFEGIGWVPFNPTPAAAAATVPAEVDPLAASARPTASTDPAERLVLLMVVFGGLAVAAGLVALIRRRRHPRPPVPVGDLLVRLVPWDAGPGTTLTDLQPALAQIGPATAQLAQEAERQRFDPEGPSRELRPRRRVWSALVRDLGVMRALLLVARGPQRSAGRPAHRASEVGAASVAPPPVRPAGG